MKSYKNITILFFLLILYSCVNQKTKINSSVIECENNITIFYPPNYNSANHSPSLAILNEPSLSKIKNDSNRKLKVEFAKLFNREVAQVTIDDNVDLYGTGEVMGDLIRNGKTVKLWNTDNYAYGKDNSQRLYQSHPWILGVGENGKSFGIIADNTWKMEISTGEKITFSSEGPSFRLIIIEKDNPKEVIQELVNITGKIELPPLWSLGFHQCRYSYYPEKRVKSIVDTMRLKQIPCDVIWMDIDYMQDFKIFSFDSIGFPNPKKTNDYLHSKNFKSVWMIDPGVKKENGYFVYDSGDEIDAWVKDSNDSTFVGKVWPGDCVFPDFTQSIVCDWWGGLYGEFMRTGIDGVWNDMNEPAVFETADWTMPKNNIHKGDLDIKRDNHLRYHNVYGMLMVRASRKGILNANPKKRPFVLTRSNFLGGHRYAATWTGDNNSSMKHLKQSIPMTLNLGLSGQPFNGPDIGGFAGNATPDLYAHWIALGAFYPFSRVHSTKGSICQEPWALGKEVEQVSREALQRRYRLLPYLYTSFWESSKTGMPVMRPLFLSYPEEKYLRKEQENFMLGNDLIIIPKWSENGELPPGNWRDVSINGEDSKNHKYHPNIKIRPGSIVPLCNAIQSTSSFSLDTITLLVSADSNLTAKGILYSDAGEGFEYLNGEYSLIEFNLETKNGISKLETKTIEGNLISEKTKLLIKLIGDNSIKEFYGDASNKINLEF